MKSLHEQLTGKPVAERQQKQRPVFQQPGDHEMIEYEPVEGFSSSSNSSLSSAPEPENDDLQIDQNKHNSSGRATKRGAAPSSSTKPPATNTSAAKASAGAVNSLKSNSREAAQQKPKPSTGRGRHAAPAASAPSETKQKSTSRKALGRSKGHQNLKPVIRNRFELKRKLGAGGMGTIYKAVDLIMVEANDKNPYLAIKILREELKNNPEAFKALQREYRKALKLAHPNIVQVYDFDRDEDLIYMTMEYLEGKDLEKVLRKFRGRGLPFAKAFSIIEGISNALIHAHAHNYIHYDFKPGNIFITSHGAAKVFDFGISRAVKQKFRPVGDETCFEPKTFTALTPTYASPEMINGETPDTRDDIYALAVVTYEVLAGVHPFERMPATDAWEQSLKPARIQGLTNKQWLTLESALEFERENRLSSVEAFRDGLLNVVSTQQVYRRAAFGMGFLMVAALQAMALTLGDNDGHLPVFSRSAGHEVPRPMLNSVPSPSEMSAGAEINVVEMLNGTLSSSLGHFSLFRR